MPVEIEARRVGEEQVGTQHEIEGAVEERQPRQRAADVTAVEIIGLVVREKPPGRPTAIRLGGAKGRKARRHETVTPRRPPRTIQAKQRGLRPNLGEHAAVISRDPRSKVRGRPAVKRVDGHRVNAARARLRRKRRRTPRDVEDVATPQRRHVEVEELGILGERAPKEGDGG